jgi:hypothetical protein
MIQIDWVALLRLFDFNIHEFLHSKQVNSQQDADRVTEELKSEIKNRFRHSALTLHPDKGGNAEEFKKLSDAYTTILKNFRIRYQPPVPQMQYIVINLSNMSSLDTTSTFTTWTEYGI